MDSARIIEIGTQGGCGIIARILLKRIPGSTPYLRYEGERAVHAAVMVDGQFIHFGSDDGLHPVSIEEFKRACREDFDPRRLELQFGETRDIIDVILAELP